MFPPVDNFTHVSKVIHTPEGDTIQRTKSSHSRRERAETARRRDGAYGFVGAGVDGGMEVDAGWGGRPAGIPETAGGGAEAATVELLACGASRAAMRSTASIVALYRAMAVVWSARMFTVSSQV